MIYNPLKVIKDWQMIVVALCITAVGVALLLLGTAIPQLRGHVMLQTNEEKPTGIAVCMTNHSFQHKTYTSPFFSNLVSRKSISHGYAIVPLLLLSTGGF